MYYQRSGNWQREQYKGSKAENKYNINAKAEKHLDLEKKIEDPIP